MIKKQDYDVLYQRGLIKEGTWVSIKEDKLDWMGSRMLGTSLVRIDKDLGMGMFEGCVLSELHDTKFHWYQIESIDSMEPARLRKAYQV